MSNFKFTMSKILILFIFILTMNSNVFGFDLKKLQEGLNQLKEQQNSGDNSNPLGNLMKNLQGTAKNMSGQLNQGSGSGGLVQGKNFQEIPLFLITSLQIIFVNQICQNY